MLENEIISENHIFIVIRKIFRSRIKQNTNGIFQTFFQRFAEANF